MMMMIMTMMIIPVMVYYYRAMAKRTEYYEIYTLDIAQEEK